MKIILLLAILLVATGCENRPRGIYYGNTSDISGTITEVIKVIESLSPGLSIEEYQAAIAKIGKVDTPYGHFKDHEYYWTIKEGSDIYIIAGAFSSMVDNLSYSTISVVEENGWRTFYSYRHDLERGLDIRLRGINSPPGD